MAGSPQRRISPHDDLASFGEHEAWLARVLETVAAGVVIIDCQGRITFVNASAEQILGRSREMLWQQRYNTTFWDISALDGTPLVMRDRPFSRVMRTKQPVYQVEYRLNRPDGRAVAVAVNAAPLFDRAGYIEAVVLSLTDITERLQNEERRRTSEQRTASLVAELDSILQNIPTGMAITDRDNRLVRANEAFVRTLGIPFSQLVGRKISDITGNPIGDILRERARQTGMTETIRAISYVLPSQPERTEAYWDLTVVPIQNEDGVTDRLLTMLNDVTEDVLFRQQLEFERARWLTTLTTFPQAIIFINTRGVVEMANRAAERVWMMPLIGKQWEEVARDEQMRDPANGTVIAPDHRPIARALRGEAVQDIETLLERHDGSRVPLLLHAAPVRLEEQVVGTVEIAQDLTKIKEADRIKDHFLATVSHDLRSPLSAIQGWAQFARETNDPAVMQEAFEVILRSVTEQRSLINDLLDAAALSAGVLRIEPVEQDIRPIVTNVVNGAQRQAHDASVTLTVEVGKKPLDVCVDSVRLQQIVSNLLMNALKFTPSAGRVTVKLHREGTQAVLRMSDTGQGIPPELLPHVFERFNPSVQAKRSQTRSLGLGLSIVKALTELHGGRIEAASAGQGRGTTITVRLPLECSNASAR
ncbi:MAG TPA: PAS domain-containing sensor histidine kinase [Armatimonadota bacterium]|jgi:hypothetical protein